MPKYMVIAEQIKQRIMSGEFENDQQLPQEVRLTKAYNVSRITIRKALDVLVSEGLIYRIQGAGTFIKDSNGNNSSVSKNQAELFDIDNLNIKVGDFSVIKPPTDVANMLEINRYDFVYVVNRTMAQGDEPVIYQELYFPIKYIQGMRMDALKSSIIDFLTDDLGVELTAINRNYSIAHLEKNKAVKINVSESESLLLIKEKIHLKDGAVGVFDKSWINTEKFSYNTRLLLD
ncbi:GntR family transcriptional regulator [Companilactobacillus sp. HBUAS56257]|uniref:GntR family transcriptional regulator n=1 Tax=Companilactobacillus sp. HBUAS56257 TaxID=3109360 RepID=UPI002FEF923B